MRTQRDRGSFTAEMAAGIPALMVLLLTGLTAVTAVSTRLQCLDAAREGALAASRGAEAVAVATSTAPEGSSVAVSADSDSTTVTVSAPVPLIGAHLPMISVGASATAALEPSVVGTP